MQMQDLVKIKFGTAKYKQLKSRQILEKRYCSHGSWKTSELEQNGESGEKVGGRELGASVEEPAPGQGQLLVESCAQTDSSGTNGISDCPHY